MPYTTPTEKAHAYIVKDLAKPGAAILKTLTPDGAHLLHMAGCIQGEAGELWDALKKHLIYNQPLDHTNVIEELGDIEFYLEGLRSRLGISRQATLEANIAKLRQRYSEKTYSDAQAAQRRDKAQAPSKDLPND